MKKQVLIAAVAASMTSVAMADISITGSAKVNYTHTDYDDAATADTNAFKNEMDLVVTGKTGDTAVVMKFSNDNNSTDNGTSQDKASGLISEDNYVTTKIGDVNLKVGDWDNGNNALRASSRGQNKFSASTSFGAVGVTYDASGDAGDDTVKVSVDVAGVNASYKGVDGGEDVSLSTSVAGVNISYLALQRDAANTDRNVIEVGGSFNGVDLKVAQAKADSGATIEGDTWMGDFEGASGAYDLTANQDVTSVSIKTAVAGNTVEFRNTDIDGVSGEDTDFQEFIVTRPLANGTTFEATYTMLDDAGSTTTDADTLDLELAVKF